MLKHFGQDSLSHKKPKLGSKNHCFYSVKMGERAKSLSKPRFGPQSRFPSENANLTNGTPFTHIHSPELSLKGAGVTELPCLDGPIRLILANRLRVLELNPFYANRASGGGG